MEAHERTLAKLYNIKKLKMGRRPPRVSLNTPQLRHFLAADLPPSPASVNWGAAVTSWGMLANDALGDCTGAGAGHAIQTWTANTVGVVAITDAMTIDFYGKTTGYNPADPRTDQGGVELDVLKWWQANSFGGLYTIDSFAAFDPKKPNLVRSAVHLMGGAYLGVALPTSAQNQAVWDVPAGGAVGDGAPGSWGLHCVWVMAYDEATVTCVTWGYSWKMTWAFFLTYVDESYALLSSLWYAHKAPNGLDVVALKKDMLDFQAQDNPPEPAPDPAPPSPPEPTPPEPCPCPTCGKSTVEAVNDPLFEVQVGKVTVDVSQAAVNLFLIILGTAMVAFGHFDMASVSAMIGAAITVITAGAHLRTIKKSNDATIDWGAQIMQVIGILKGKIGK